MVFGVGVKRSAPVTHLEQLDEDGNKIFWSRGNGRVYAGVVNILRALPKDHPLREHYMDLYKDMSETIAGLQQDNGLWRVSLPDCPIPVALYPSLVYRCQ